MKDQESNRNQQEADQSKKSLNVLHREPGAPTAGGPDRQPASGEESSEGTLNGVAQPSAGALSGLDEGETWENKSEIKTKTSPGATPEEQRDQQTR